MKIAIVGATGFIGTRFVKFLERDFPEIELVIFGRSIQKLTKVFPSEKCFDYSNIPSNLIECNAVVYLATKNNSSAGSFEEFEYDNVTQMLKFVATAKQVNVPTFVHCSTIHVIGINHPSSNYARSKLLAEEKLEHISGIAIVNLRLASVYAEISTGKLSVFNRLPSRFRSTAFSLISVIRPTVHIDNVLTELLSGAKSQERDSICLSSNISETCWYAKAKRFSDLAASICLLLCTFWIFPFIYIWIKIDSEGSGFFVQERLGKNKKLFNCYKFRTMRMGTSQTSTHEISKASVTRAGKYLRATKLDELPQLINILKNEMSLVGPRPCLPSQSELIYHRDELAVFDTMPGITGLAQVRGIDMSSPKVLARVDSDYVQRRGLLFDFNILLHTLIGRGSGDKVNQE